jgi:hypothetical protein
MPPSKRSGMELDVRSVVLRLMEDSAIMREEKAILSLKAETYGAPIMLNEDERGIIFLGSGDYLVNSRIKTSVGTFSKQYVDSFKNWGLIVGNVEKWADVRKRFTETEDTPKGFIDRGDFISIAKENLHKMVRNQDVGGIGKADWFYKVEGEKGEATLHYMGRRIAFAGCHAALATTNEEEVTLVEGNVNLAVHGDKIAVVSREANEKEVKVGSLSLLPETLEKLGYNIE